MHMNKVLTFFSGMLLVILVAGCDERPGASEAPKASLQDTPNPRRIAIDVGLIVKDMDASLAFYRDLLSLEFVTELTTSLIGKGQMIQLRHGESLVKLVEMEAPPVTESPAGITGAFGFRYITLMVENIENIVAKVEREKTPIALELTELGNGAKILMIVDPDGNIVEFVQEP